MAKMTSPVAKVVTHPGVFHADDAFAVAALRLAFPGIEVTRGIPSANDLADPNVVVVDIGGQFDEELSNYDHHQRGGAGCRTDGPDDDLNAPYAASGLVWASQAVREAVCWAVAGVCDYGTLNAVAGRVDLLLFRGIDAADCGKGRKQEKGESPSVSQIIAWLNPGASASSADRDAAFMRAVGIAEEILIAAVRNAKEWHDARNVVLAAPALQGVLVLETFVPWNEHVFSRRDESDLLYVVFPSKRGGYMVQQVPKVAESFEGRLPLPEAWAGLRDGALAEVCGVVDAVFCHPGRFCGGAKSKGGAITMAHKAVVLGAN